MLSRDGVITFRRTFRINRDVCDMHRTLRVVFLKIRKFCRNEVRKNVQYILACSSGARLLSAAKARE